MAFTHLHTHSEYSLLDGAGRITDIIRRTKELGMDSIALTDHGVMYGVVDFYKEAKKEGIHPVIGCEVYVAPTSRHERKEIDGVKYYHLILLAENNKGYQNLTKLVSLGNIEGAYYKPRVDKELLRRYHEGIICLSACIAGEIPRAVLAGRLERAEELVLEYADIFGTDNFFLEIQNHGLSEEETVNAELVRLAKKHGIGLVATNDAHYVRRSDAELHDILLCVQMGKTVNDPDRMRFSSDDYYLKSEDEMRELFVGEEYEEAFANTAKIAARCQVDFVFGELLLPHYPIPDGFVDAPAYLRHICEERLSRRYDEITAEISERLDYELSVIRQMGYDGYFLIVWDFIDYARRHDIAVGPGRGSAAGSIVAYLLGITNIDPLKYALLFERFLNPERVTMPDIDIDFCYINRGKVIDYVKERYGEDHVAQIVTFGTMGAKGAIRDVGRALDIPYGDVNTIAKLVPNELNITLERTLNEVKDFRRLYNEDEVAHQLIDLARQVEGLTRHSSIHAAGIVIAPSSLTDFVPVSTSDDGTLVTEFAKDQVEELGLLKMDFLGLRTLTIIADTVANIKKVHGITIDIDNIPIVDELAAKMLCTGGTGAIFQMESPGMTKLVKELQPEGFTDLIPLVALYRPGPLGSGMVDDFIDGRHGRKEAIYMHPLLEPILKETFGVVLYQEQVMQIVQVLAGFSLGQADLLRRAMGKKKAAILMAQKENFLVGCEQNNVDKDVAAKIFDLLTHFADYGFNKSHSAAYALVAWQTAYLKAHYPVEFMAAMLTSIMDDSKKVPVYVQLARDMGIKILPPDINSSEASFSVEDGAIRFGLAAVRNVGETAIESMACEREREGRFTTLMDFCSRVDMRVVNKRVVESLIKCGAFDSLNLHRSQLLAIMDGTLGAAAQFQKDTQSGQQGLFGEELVVDSIEVPIPNIPEIDSMTKLQWEKESTGFYITGHPLDSYRDTLELLPTVSRLTEEKVSDKKSVRLGGMLKDIRRLTTKKGDTMCQARLEDFTGQLGITVFPRTFYQYAALLEEDSMIVMQGRIDTSDEELKVIVDSFWSLPDYKFEYYLELPGDMREEDKAVLWSRLKEIFAAHRGAHPVYLKSAGAWKRLADGYNLSGAAEAVGALEKVLGDGSVKRR